MPNYHAFFTLPAPCPFTSPHSEEEEVHPDELKALKEAKKEGKILTREQEDTLIGMEEVERMARNPLPYCMMGIGVVVLAIMLFTSWK